MISIGQSHRQFFRFSQDDVDNFIKISGDSNPLHHSEEYCRNTIFKKPIIHGSLSSTIFSKLLGMNLPGEGTIYLSQHLSFLKPMYVGEQYEGIVEVTAIFPKKNICTLSTIVLDKAGNKMIEGEAKIMNKKKIFE